jgi:hypothetical protein
MVKAEHLEAGLPDLGLDLSEILRSDQIPMRIVCPTVYYREQSPDLLDLPGPSSQHSAAFARIRPLALAMDCPQQRLTDP